MPISRTRRRSVLVVAVLTLTSAAAAVIWQYTRNAAAPPATPPDVNSQGVDPSVLSAIEAGRRKVLSEPKSAAAWGEYGKLLFAHTFETEADVCFQEADKLDPDDGRWPYYRGVFAAGRDPAVSISHFRKAVACKQPNPAYASVARLRLAEALLDRQELHEAAKIFDGETESETDASRARAAYGLGLVEVAQDDLATARRYFETASASPFARQKASAQLARINRLQGDVPAANRYEEAATRPPQDRAWPDPFIAEANKLRVGQQQTLQEADALARRGRPDEAARLLANLSRDFPNEQTFQAIGAVLIQMGDYIHAEQELRHCLDFDPTHPQAHHLLALALFLNGESSWKRGEQVRAKELFRLAADHAGRATERKPDFASAYLYRGRALLYLDEREEAIASLRKAVECRPEIADGHLYLGEALIAVGRAADARVSLKLAAQLAGPTDDRPRAALAKLEQRE